MHFSELLRDSVLIRKKDGTSNGPYKCGVQSSKIHIMEADVDADEGDSVERQLPNNKVETYSILEANFSKGLHSIPDSWILHVRKDASLKPTGGRTTNIHIANASAIQIGDYNVQHVSSVLQSLVTSIDESDAPDEQKQEAKNKLSEFLKHPAVIATLGAGATAIAKAVFGG